MLRIAEQPEGVGITTLQVKKIIYKQ